MNDDERADWLARAIDDLLKAGRAPEPPQPPPEFENDEVTSLLRVASERIELSESLTHTSLQYEAEVWQSVLHRLDRRRFPRKVRPLDPEDAEKARVREREMERLEIEELRQLARLRRQIAEQAASLAETHREDVWQRIQSRIERPPETRKLAFRLARRSGDDPEPTQGQSPNPPSIPFRKLLPRLAVAASVAVIAVAGLGPIPLTGLADHPAASVVRFMGDQVGVRESAPPDAIPPVTEVVEGTPVSAEEAERLLSIPVGVPAFIPENYSLASSLYYDEPITAEKGGVFVLQYVRPGEAGGITIYQERAEGAELTVGADSTTPVVLSDGTRASYVQGAWQTAGQDIEWISETARTLTFDRGATRTIIVGGADDTSLSELISIADSIGQ